MDSREDSVPYPALFIPGHGADPLLEDCDGKTALQKAIERGHERVANIIKAAAPTNGKTA